MKPSLVLAGHSHLAAFGTPIADGEGTREITVAHTDASVRAIAGAMPRTEDYWSMLERNSGDAVPVLLWEGTQHQDRFLIETSSPIDFVLSLAPTLPLDPRASYVAEGQLRAVFAPRIDPLGPLIARLVRAGGGGPVLVAGTPPPTGDEVAIRARLVADPARVAAAQAGGIDLATVRLGSGYTLQKLWSLIQAMTAEVTVAAGGTFVPVPDRLRGSDGFLPERLLADDAIHANAAYGAEMLTEIVAAATSRSQTRNTPA